MSTFVPLPDTMKSISELEIDEEIVFEKILLQFKQLPPSLITTKNLNFEKFPVFLLS